ASSPKITSMVQSRWIGHEEKMIFTGFGLRDRLRPDTIQRDLPGGIGPESPKQDGSFDRESGAPKEPMSMWHTRPTGSAHDEPQSLLDPLDRPRRESGQPLLGVPPL